MMDMTLWVDNNGVNLKKPEKIKYELFMTPELSILEFLVASKTHALFHY